MVIEIRNLSIKFQKQVFENASFEAYEGQVTSISGKSGSGKTTLLKFIMGEYFQNGQLFYNQSELTKENRDDFLFHHVSYIDQEGHYFPNMTVFQHFDFYSQLHGIDLSLEQIHKYLKKVHLDHISVHDNPKILSTGERKRFLISLALMTNKSVLLLDEPTASIDKKNTIELMELLRELCQEGILCIVSTHDSYVLNNSDTIYEIHDKKLVNTKKSDIVTCKKENVLKGIQKIKYRKYMNMKMKLIFLALVFLGGLSMIYISKNISHLLTTQFHFSQVTEKNDRLYFVKYCDERYDFNTYSDVLSNDYNYIVEADVLNEDDIKTIKSIEGVKDVIALDTFQKSRQSSPIHVYQNNTHMKTVQPLGCANDMCYNRDIIVTAYYPQEGIIKDGKEINGIYVNSILDDILKLSSYDGISVSFETNRLLGYQYNEYDGKKILDGVLTKEETVMIPIDGVLSNEEYDDERYADMGRIYMPYEQFKQFVETNFDNDEESYDDIISYEPKSYLLIVEEGKNVDIKIALEQKSDLYLAMSQSLSSHAVQNHLKTQNQSILLMTLTTSLGLMIALMCLVYYSIYQRKEEIILLQREGLYRHILKYLRDDNKVLCVCWCVISLVGMGVVLWVFEVNRSYFSIPFYVFYWMMTTFLLCGFILFVQSLVIKSIRDKVLNDDKFK